MGGWGKLVAAKTNAVRLLESLGINYELRQYNVDPDDLTADTVAAKIGLPPEQVFKTLVARGDRECDTVPLAEVQALTGYVRGGVTAFAGKKDYPVWSDESATPWDAISISAGTRGLQMLVAPDDYLRVKRGRYAAIAREK